MGCEKAEGGKEEEVMSMLNQIGIIVLISISVISAGIKWYTRRRLREIDGMGAIYKEQAGNHKVIYME